VANELELSGLHRGHDVDERELARYREGLARRIHETRREAAQGRGRLAVAAALLLAAGIAFLPGRTAALDADAELCRAHPDGSAMQAAARGLGRDPRPEMRAMYLEYLLDHADRYRLAPERIERAMERETDAECLELWERLLRLATHVG